MKGNLQFHFRKEALLGDSVLLMWRFFVY